MQEQIILTYNTISHERITIMFNCVFALIVFVRYLLINVLINHMKSQGI